MFRSLFEHMGSREASVADEVQASITPRDQASINAALPRQNQAIGALQNGETVVSNDTQSSGTEPQQHGWGSNPSESTNTSRLPCSECGNTFSRRDSLKRHEKRCKADTENPHKCQEPNCGKDFHRRDLLNQHMKVHQKKRRRRLDIACPICKETFKRKDVLRRHKRTEHADPPYPEEACLCTYDGCGRRLSRPDKLEDHIKHMHTQQKS